MEKKVGNHDHDKYITNSEFNNLTPNNFTARLAQSNLVTNINLNAISSIWKASIEILP